MSVPRSPLVVRLTFRVGTEPPSRDGRETAPGVVSAVVHRGTGGVWIEWDGIAPDRSDDVRAYEVLVDGAAVGKTFDTRFLHLPEPPWRPDTSHSVAVEAVEESGERRRVGREIKCSATSRPCSSTSIRRGPIAVSMTSL